MKAKDLILELSKRDPELEVEFEATSRHICCGDGPCYCQDETERYKISDIDKEVLSIKGTKMKASVIMLRSKD